MSLSSVVRTHTTGNAHAKMLSAQKEHVHRADLDAPFSLESVRMWMWPAKTRMTIGLCKQVAMVPGSVGFRSKIMCNIEPKTMDVVGRSRSRLAVEE